MKKYYFKVKFGFEKTEYVTVDEYEVEKAIFAQIKGTPVQLGTSFINGKHIISITPDYHKHTGWNDWYEPKSTEDFLQIKRDCPDYEGIIENKKGRVIELMQSGNNLLIGKPQS